MLAVVSRFKWSHIDYLWALAEQFELSVAWAGEGAKGAVKHALREGMPGVGIGRVEVEGAAAVRSRLHEVVTRWRPEVVHIMYYNHEELTLIVRELVGDGVTVVYECRDPLTTLTGASPGSESFHLERDALCASDAQIFVSDALRSYLQAGHGLDFGSTSLIVPHGFSRRVIARPSGKLSARDGRVHVALVGTADDRPDHGRWYVDIIRSLVSLGLVVHSHFYDLEGVSQKPYRALARELGRYHHHPVLPNRQSTVLSKTISRYDLMGVFHELAASHENESSTLAVCLPTKAVCGWLHGGIPVVCRPHYRGVVEQIQTLDIGFVIDGLEDLRGIASDPGVIASATERCLAHRDVFTHERHAERIRDFVYGVLGS